MFKTRLLSGIVLVILALFLIISGHEILLFATLAISCIGMFELYRVFKMEKTVLAGVGYLAAIVYYCNLQWKFLPDLMILFMAFLILLMFVFVFAYPKFHADQVITCELLGGLPGVQVEQLGGEVDGISIGPASETVIVGFVQHHTGVVVGVERTAHHAMAVGLHAVHLSHLPNGDGGLDLLI